MAGKPLVVFAGAQPAPAAAGDTMLNNRDKVLRVLRAALRAADPYHATLRALQGLQSPAHGEVVAGSGRVFLIGAGKAGAPMARAAEEFFGERISRGLVIVKDGHANAGGAGTRLRRTRLREAAHPVPDERGLQATAEIMGIAHDAEEGDLVVCLISGGGSALMVQPAEGVTLPEVQRVTGLLLKAGANINELNAVRKHLSAVSGGQLARIAAPAQVLSLILSDVIGSPLDVVASGPTVPDPTSYSMALDVLEHYELMPQVPLTLASRLRTGRAGLLPETPKPGDPLFERVRNVLVGGNVQAVEAAAEEAKALGLNTSIITTYLEGEARQVGGFLATLAREMQVYGRPMPPPACLLFGGETTVTVLGKGVGGRNSELALGAALGLQGLGPSAIVASLATDGGDGASPGAGGIVDGTTVERGARLGLDAQASLADNDTYTYLSKVGDAIQTGPTGTNVNDIMAVFAFDSGDR